MYCHLCTKRGRNLDPCVNIFEASVCANAGNTPIRIIGDFPINPVMRRQSVYLIGSLRNPSVPWISDALRKAGFEVFDDWHAFGPEADDHWKRYEQARGRSHREALEGEAAKNAFNFDKRHIDASDIGVLVMPCGKSGHLELGYMLGRGKPGHIVFPDGELEDRWDVMHLFATSVSFSTDELLEKLS